MLKKKILILFLFLPSFVFSKESNDKLCFKRGVEVILPYQHGIEKIKTEFHLNQTEEKQLLKNYNKMFKEKFFGLGLYESSGCSKARLSEYLDCLIETDGKNCRIYYSQMRLVD
tara:strand:- start:279 stop:620 length:342 start_codon:yes stop_codon:yes gene_type:complete